MFGKAKCKICGNEVMFALRGPIVQNKNILDLVCYDIDKNIKFFF